MNSSLEATFSVGNNTKEVLSFAPTRCVLSCKETGVERLSRTWFTKFPSSGRSVNALEEEVQKKCKRTAAYQRSNPERIGLKL